MKADDSCRWAQVIVDIPHRDIDRPFTYRIPDTFGHSVLPGCEVWVPFQQRTLRGWVLDVHDQPPENRGHFSNIEAFHPGYRLGEDLLALVPWLAREVLGTMADVLRLMAPPGPSLKPAKWVKLSESIGKEQIDLWQGIDPECGQLLQRLFRAPRKQMKFSSLVEKSKKTSPSLERLLEAGLVELVQRLPPFRFPEEKDVESSEGTPSMIEPALNQEQVAAVQAIIADLEKSHRDKKPFLLHGVTGSGKTEIYIQAAKKALAMGRQVLFLVPEIALTPQMGRRLRERFGSDVLLLHSGLTEKVRRSHWYRISRGEASLVIGPRSAVFAPVPNLGLIIVDEEHEPSYHQENDLKYHAREVAIERARHCGALVIIGSATPAIETYDKAMEGSYRILRLTERAQGQPMPVVDIVDMRAELTEGNRGMLSASMLQAIEERLRRREQTILYLNRRGFSTFVICRECGTVITCPHCSISLVYHRAGDQMHCHYCNFRRDVPRQCPQCASKTIRYFGAGTQRVEEELQARFPGVPVLRMDRDVAAEEGIEPVLEEFGREEAPILVGTQMIAKGLDFPKVTLVGVLAADASLHVSDFRAVERTYQLLSQVSGRAGRANRSGQVILQTYCPEHYCLQAVQNHNYEGFFQREIEIRQQLGYPPFSRLARILFTGTEDSLVRMVADTWTEIIREHARKSSIPLDIWGPAPAPVAKVEDKYRWMLTVRLSQRDNEPLRTILSNVRQDYDSRRGRPLPVIATITMDP
ncbi:primosomal protein N' [Heliobacillus mobilis]